VTCPPDRMLHLRLPNLSGLTIRRLGMTIVKGGILLMHKESYIFKLPAQRYFRNEWCIPILILALSLVVSGIIIVLPLPHPQSAHASNATLTVSPIKGAYTNRSDQTPITVQGTLYMPNEVVKVYWNYTGPGTGNLEATATANAKGNFSVDFLRVLA